MSKKIEMPVSELRRRVLWSFIDGLSSAQDKKDTLVKLIEDYAEAIRREENPQGELRQKEA